MSEREEERAAELREAQSEAAQLFHAIEEQGLIRAGITESRLNADIYALDALKRHLFGNRLTIGTGIGRAVIHTGAFVVLHRIAASHHLRVA